MAYSVDGKGPYPNLAGEFCGNYHPDLPITCCGDESPADAEEHNSQWLATMWFGKPSRCDHSTSDEMAVQGWVGLYLRADHPLHYWETPVETDALTEAVVSTAEKSERWAAASDWKAESLVG